MASSVPQITNAPQPRALPKPPSAAESKGRPRFNYYSSSSRDDIVFGAERPGQPKPNPDAPSTPRGPQVAGHVVDQWCIHLKTKGVKRLLCLLTDGELGFYGEPLLPHLSRHFPDPAHGCVRVDPMAEDSLGLIAGCLDGAVKANEPIVVFCSTGQARTGMVLAFWVHHKYNVPVGSAVTEVIEHASAGGATRKPSVEQVMQFVIGPGARAMLPSMKATGQGAGGGAIAFGTPRVDDRLHITFLQTGGTIDKDYPRLVGGYSFEISDPAVGRLLQNASPAAFTHDVLSVCRKDSQEITVEDRQALVETIRRLSGTKFIATHGTDTMIETAQYVAAAKGIAGKTVVFTGAMRPAKMVDSDASFNVGVAVGALNVLGAGVYLAMNGRVYEAASVRRDGRTGLFVAV